MATTLVVPRIARHWPWRFLYRHRWPYLFISPFYICFAIFTLYPVLFSLYLSFTSWKGLGPIKWIGWGNFQLLLRDRVFWQSMLNGVLLFFLYVPVMTLAALVLAVVLNSPRVRASRVFRTAIFAPYVTNMLAAGFVFRILLDTGDGLFNIALTRLGLPAIPWLDSQWGARVSLAILIIWAWLGYNMVIMLTGLQTIPRELSEAALIDGAAPWQSFWYITVPLMRPIILFSVTLSVGGTFSLFTEVFVLTGGGPSNATITPILYIFRQAFGSFRFGYASALAYIYFALIFIWTAAQVRFFSRGEER
ncbi:MAG: sugar ABC transporter permease [Deinococcus sp.]|nr:sugar ABC transporter permease [Deinococcus sp.]